MVDNLDNGQLNVKLDLILDQLEKMSKNMVTKDVFDVWKEGNTERIARLEKDLGDWIAESTAAHVRLDAESKARHAETIAADSAMRTYIDNRLEAAETREEQLNEGIKNRKNAMAGVWVAVVIGGALTVAGLVIQLVQVFK